MNKNLVPKVITDKNGVTTTRWVKPEKAASSVSDIPPVSPNQATPAATDAHLVESLVDWFKECDEYSIDVEAVVKAIPTYGNDTLELLSAEMLRGTEGRDTAALWISLYSDQETYLRELFTYRDAFDPSTDYSFIEEAVHYLHEYDELPKMKDYSKADEDLKQKIYDVLAVTESAIAEDYEASREGNDPILPADLRQLVMDRPYDLDRINEIILENPGVRSGEQIAMMLDSDAPAVRDGIL